MIDARGYACPLPVLMVQREVKRTEAESLTVLVDNHAAVQNVTRFANSRGYKVKVTEQGEDFLLELTKE
ncbi:MAG: sulfurtransferase TusA family protein [Clostridia bacterium]|nr:sulfurtransferase TusA family protein [Clostridia bacterium]